MRVHTRISTFLSLSLAGCGTRELDDEACLNVAVGAPCPDADAAHDELMGSTTCEDPVRKVVATGAFIDAENVVYTGYGGWDAWTTGDTGAPDQRCCYEAAYRTLLGQSCIIGRPLAHDGAHRTAAPANRQDWRSALSPRLDGLEPAARAALAAAWTDAALLEHASIPAFARLALDLIALGAPAELITRTNSALADEIRHAADGFALASAYAGRPVGPSALPLPAAPPSTLLALAVDTFREGCVGETLSVGLATAQLRDATDPAVRAALARIVGDEARHAELAWDIVAWAIAVGGPEIRAAVAEEADHTELPRWVADGALAGHGLPRSERVQEALEAVLVGVIRPTAAELLAA